MVCLVHREILGVDGRSRAGTGGVERHSTAVSQTMIGFPLERFDPGEEGLRTARPPAGRQDPGTGVPGEDARPPAQASAGHGAQFFALRLVAQQPDDAHRDAGQGIERIGQRDAAIAPEHVAAVRGHGDSGTEPEVLRFPFEPRRVAHRELQRPSFLRQLARNGVSDCPRGPRTNAVSVTSFIAPFSCCSPVPWRRSRPAESLPRQAPGMDWPADGGNGYWRSPVGDVGGHRVVRLRPLPQRQPTTSLGSMKRTGTGAETGARAACSGVEQRHPPLAAREEVAGTLVQAVGE